MFAPSEVLTKTDDVVTGSTPNRETLVKMATTQESQQGVSSNSC